MVQSIIGRFVFTYFNIKIDEQAREEILHKHAMRTKMMTEWMYQICHIENKMNKERIPIHIIFEDVSEITSTDFDHHENQIGDDDSINDKLSSDEQLKD